MNEIFKKIYLAGIVPVVKIDNADDAVPLANALCAGGLPVAEVTFRTAAGEQAIKNITAAVPDMLVGAGTVLTTEQVDRAIAAGASFIVTPGFNRRVVEYCVNRDIPICPGCPTSSDIEAALELGLKTVKFFPAENLGGIAMIKALAAPYVGVTFMPTGGINAGNLNSYLSCDKILACGGSWMVKDTLINNGEFDTIESLAKEAVTTMLGFKFDHITVNEDTEGGFKTVSELLNLAFNVQISTLKVRKPSEGKPLGTLGQITITCNNVDRSAAYLENKAIAIDHSADTVSPSGKLTSVTLAEEYGGFRVKII